jgi:hypothetical protein
MASEQEMAAVVATVSHELAAWAAAHPEATLLELEVETTRQLQAVQRQVLSGLLAERATATGACPRCGGGPLRVRTTAARTVLLAGDEALTLQRPYLVCAACGQGHFPPGRPVGAAAE